MKCDASGRRPEAWCIQEMDNTYQTDGETKDIKLSEALHIKADTPSYIKVHQNLNGVPKWQEAISVYNEPPWSCIVVGFS